jgi:signal peptidase I
MTIELITRYVKILIAFVLVWTGVWLFNNFGCSRVDGDEMQPALPMEKNALIDPRVRQPDQLNREDVVAFLYDIGGKGVSRKITARVTGLPGDRVKMVKGDLFVNGEKISSSSDKKAAPDDYPEIIVPRNTLFLLCDNRGKSKNIDSRSLGPVGYWALVGKLR